MNPRRVHWLAVLLLALRFPSTVFGEEFAADIRARFTPREPTVSLTYRVSYRVMGIEILQVASARVGVTVGLWRGEGSEELQDASLVDFTLDTMETRETDRKRNIHVVLHNKVLAVLRRPELDTVVFAKRTDQSFQFLWNKKRADNLEIYDLERGSLRYHCFDYLRAAEITNLVGHAELAREGKEVCRLLRLAHDAYEQETMRGQILTRDIPVHVYIQGDLVPYAIKVKERNAAVRFLGHTIPSLRLWAYPLKRRGNRAYGCESWTVSFRDLAERADPSCLAALGGDIAEWIMIPLIADLDLPLGAIRGLLTEFSVVPQPPGKVPPADR